MSYMSKNNLNFVVSYLRFLLIFILAGVPQSGFGKNILQVETGNHQSASWQFTIELSGLWQKQFPEMGLSISPSYTSDIETRFKNLEQKNSRFVIAPLDTTANQIMLNRPIRLITVLWEVYLIPIDISRKNEPINLNNYRYWYISEHSVIVPKLMQALNKPSFAEAVRSEYESRIPFVKEPEIITEEESDQPLFKPFEISPAEDSQSFYQSAQIAELNDFDTEILQIKNETIQEIVSEYREGILFYEMIGSMQHLKNVLENHLTTTYFSQNVQDFLVSVHPWIQPVHKRRAGLKTVGFNMAFFVHADEDPEFVIDIIKLLSVQPKSYFPTSFIFSNLSIQKTKDVSPIFMHAGSLDYFDLD